MKKILSIVLTAALLCSFTAFCFTMPNTQVIAGTSDDNPPDSTAYYTNGMYVQGAQVRTTGTMGLRFVGVINETMLNELESEGAINVEYGFLVLANASTSLLYSNAQAVKAEKIYRSPSSTGGDYRKFTACIINIPTGKYKTKVTVRPYLRYNHPEYGLKIMYGTSYSADLYSVAKAAYNGNTETSYVKNYLLNNILYVANPDFPDEYTGGIYKP